MKAYKGFDKDMKCRGFRFEEGKTYEEPEAKLCEKGFHACEAPLDVLRYYPINRGNVYREVECEEVSEEKQEDSKLVCKKLTVGAEIGILGLIKAHIEYTRNKAKKGKSGGYRSNLAGGNGSNLAGGEYSNLAGGNGSNLAGGEYSNLAGGYRSNLAGGEYSNLAGGNGSNLAGGEYSNLAGGDCSNLAGGNGSNLAGGDCSNLAGGYRSNLAGGDSALVVARNGSKAKAGLKSVIVLTEWEWRGSDYVPVGVKAEIVDGKRIKADTWYRLKDGEFEEVKSDGAGD